MCSLEILDNVLLSLVSDECEYDRLYVSKVKSVNKIHSQSCKRNASKGSKFKLKQKSTRTMSTLFWCLTSYKVTPFLVFVVAKI